MHGHDTVLDLGNGLGGVEMLRAGLRAVEDAVASVQLEGVVQRLETLLGELVTRVVDPAESLLEDSGTEVLLGVPPVARARSRAACAENALVHTIKLSAVLLRLQGLLTLLSGSLTLQPGLDGSVLLVEVEHVRDEVLDNVHVRKRVDLGDRGLGVNVSQAREGVGSVNVHGARAANSLTARAAERQSGVDLVLDLDQRIENHRAALSEVDGANQSEKGGNC